MKGAVVISLLVGAIVSQASWRSDVSSTPIPAGPANGKLHGKTFQPILASMKKLGMNTAGQNGKIMDRAQAYVLKFASDREFFPAQSMEVWFSTDPGKPLSGTTLAMKPYAFGDEGAHRQSYGNRKGGALVPRGVTAIFASYRLGNSKLPETDTHSDRYSIRLEFGKQAGKSLPGKVYVTLPDASKSYLMGSFTAKME